MANSYFFESIQYLVISWILVLVAINATIMFHTLCSITNMQVKIPNAPIA